MLIKRSIWLSLVTLTLTSCMQPPFNQFQKPPPNVKPIVVGVGIGALAGGLIGNAISGAALGGAVAGALAGGGVGTASSIFHASKRSIIEDLNKADIQFVEYGDTMTLVVPTDHYFMADSSRLNELCYRGLNSIVQLLELYPCSQIYVAGFTDNVGSREHQLKRSQSQAEAMVTFLWAHKIPANYLKPEGYGKRHSLGDNHLIRGSAYNRRIEIQWFNVPKDAKSSLVSAMKS